MRGQVYVVRLPCVVPSVRQRCGEAGAGVFEIAGSSASEAALNAVQSATAVQPRTGRLSTSVSGPVGCVASACVDALLPADSGEPDAAWLTGRQRRAPVGASDS